MDSKNRSIGTPTVLPASESTISRAAAILASGGLVAFPTETVYGLGADARNPEAVEKIYAAKGRPSCNPLIAHIPSLDALSWITPEPWITSHREILHRLSSFIPGPLSLVVPFEKRVCARARADLNTVAVRVPRHDVALSLLQHCDFPVVAPSANPSNYLSPTTATHVADQLGDRIDLIIDGGPCTVGIESTILDLTSPHPTVLRPGGISHEALENVLGISIEALSLKEQEPKTVLAPGMLRTHYAPRTPLLLVDDRTAIPHYDRIGVISLSEHSTIFDSVSATHRAAFSAEGQLEEVSQNLFRVLREFDTLDLDIILVERCASQGLGRAIVDRLQRASVR